MPGEEKVAKVQSGAVNARARMLACRQTLSCFRDLRGSYDAGRGRASVHWPVRAAFAALTVSHPTYPGAAFDCSSGVSGRTKMKQQ